VGIEARRRNARGRGVGGNRLERLGYRLLASWRTVRWRRGRRNYCGFGQKVSKFKLLSREG